MDTETSASGRLDQEMTGASVPEVDLNAAELRKLLEVAQAKITSTWNDLVRTRAEIENVRRRAQRDVEAAHRFALERFALDLLPVRDSLELGLSPVIERADPAKLREGMDLTLKILTGVLAKFGINEINPVNERFNPELHQAMTVQPSSTVPPNTVLTCYQKGYTLNERLLRPALVVVAQAAPAGDEEVTGNKLDCEA